MAASSETTRRLATERSPRASVYTALVIISGDQWRRNEFESGGRGARVRCENGGGGDFVLVVPLHFFGSKSTRTISRFGERFRGGQ